jgi:hypothetical protein
VFNQFYKAAVIKEVTELESGYTAPTPVQMPAPQLDPTLETASGSVVTNPRRGPPRNAAKPKTWKGKKIADRRALSAAMERMLLREIEQLQNVPSLKWTWGVDLDDMVRMADTGYQLPHSGYDEDLISGTNTRDLSNEATDPGSRGIVNKLGSNVQSVGSLHEKEIPTHFCHPLLERAVDPS